jgi:predicted dienelactone hydrolase
VAPDPAEAGPYRVGYREASLTWQAPRGDGTTEARVLRVAAWYPTEATSGAEVRYKGGFEAPGVLGGAPARPGVYPGVVYSHGFQGYAEASGRLCAHFASHGWVVIAPEHPGTTLVDFRDRDVTDYLWRPGDVRAALDAWEAGALGELPAAPATVVGLGHSYGGYAQLAVGGARWDVDGIDARCGGDSEAFECTGWDAGWRARFAEGALDPRVSGLVVMAPGDFDLFGAAGLAEVEVPVLHLTGALDARTTPEGANEPIWAALPAGARRVDLLTGGHLAFTDSIGNTALDTSIGDLDALEAVVRAAALGFARTMLDAEDEVAAQALEEARLDALGADVTVAVKAP